MCLPKRLAKGVQHAGLGKVHRVEANLQFLGHVTDTRNLYACADVLLMTSRFEGTPLTILEAMAMRTPIVAPQLDGIGEILRPDEDALLIEPPERDLFVQAIERLAADAGLAARLADSAHTKVHAQFSAEAMAAQVEAIYERCLARRGVRSASADDDHAK